MTATVRTLAPLQLVVDVAALYPRCLLTDATFANHFVGALPSQRSGVPVRRSAV